MEGKVADVVAGMSLPICLEAAAQMNTMSVEKLVQYLSDNSASYTKVLSVVNQEQAEEEDEF